jgi:hypothetical protein
MANPVLSQIFARRSTKSRRSSSVRNIAWRSSPRTITWWRAPGASRRGPRGMGQTVPESAMWRQGESEVSEQRPLIPHGGGRIAGRRGRRMRQGRRARAVRQAARVEKPRACEADKQASRRRKPWGPVAPEGKRRGYRASVDPSPRTRGIPPGHPAAPGGSVSVGGRPAAAGGWGFPLCRDRAVEDPILLPESEACPPSGRVEPCCAVSVIPLPPYLGWTPAVATAGWYGAQAGRADRDREPPEG